MRGRAPRPRTGSTRGSRSYARAASACRTHRPWSVAGPRDRACTPSGEGGCRRRREGARSRTRWRSPCDRGRDSGGPPRCHDYQMSSLGQFPHRIRPARGDPEGVLVLLHGRGTNEHDLFPLLDLLDPEARLVGVTPRAPLSLPPGGAHWYAVREVGFPDPGTFFPTYRPLTEWVDALPVALG